MRKIILSLIAIAFIFSSCSITKRKYTGGYSIQWHKKAPPIVQETKQAQENTNVTASIDKPIPIEIKQPIFTDSVLCDEITLLNGTLIKGKVEEIGVNEIKYRDCDNLSGPVTDIEKSTVFMIRYANGKRTVINTATATDNTKEDEENKNIVLTPEQQKYVDEVNSNDNTQQSSNGSGLATAALVCGILALVAWYGSFVLGLLALIFGGSAMARINRSMDKFGKGSATAGIVLGIIAMAFWTFILLSGIVIF